MIYLITKILEMISRGESKALHQVTGIEIFVKIEPLLSH